MNCLFLKKIFAWLSDYFMMPDWLASIFIWIFRAFVIVTIIILFFRYKDVQQSYNRVLKDGYLKQYEVQYYKAKNGDIIAKQNVQLNTIKELESLNHDVCQKLDNLSIKYKHLQQYSQTSFITTGTIKAPIKDTTIIEQGNNEYITESFTYQDSYLYLQGIKQQDKTQVINYAYTDSLIQVTYKGDRISKKGRKMPSWWFFTPKILQQSIKASNPATTIKYNKTVNIVK